ncbi:MAG: hypothetical protein P8I11_03235 [Bacteroidia bacterium]|nr:hypothetical protein [Bacteroidia bacterium]
MSIIQSPTPSFKEEQLKYDRVFQAYKDKSEDVYAKLKKVGIHRQKFEIFIRGFKFEEDLEVWAKNFDEDHYKLVTTYNFCQNVGELGPKRVEGDKQIPEGIYSISKFNPNSDFFLSLKIDYPNKSDRLLSDHFYPGGLIFIHGGCETIGCIPITNNFIKELYILCVEAKNNGQESIPIHLFPARLTLENFQLLSEQYSDKKLLNFWAQLKLGYSLFEKNRKIPEVFIYSNGAYDFGEK